MMCAELEKSAEDGVGTRLLGDMGGLEAHWAVVRMVERVGGWGLGA